MLVRSGWASGAAVGDYNNDGFEDLFLTYWGQNVLYRNNGDGTFTDVTQHAGVGLGDRVCVAAAWGDYDNDGYPDLFVTSTRGGNVLFHNNGDGTFTEAGAGSDIHKALGKALGVVATDVNGDGLMDLFVANDTVQNFLFMNRGKGTWEEIGLQAEVGFSVNGQPRSGMGVVFGGGAVPNTSLNASSGLVRVLSCCTGPPAPSARTSAPRSRSSSWTSSSTRWSR